MPKNIEIKARCHEPARIRNILETVQARFIGTDNQVDTYFTVPNGRLKLRQGNIENNLIFYQRHNAPGPKKSDVLLYKPTDAEQLKQILQAALGILVQVKKKREIFFVDNVKIHIDRVDGLGSFVEIEAQDFNGKHDEDELLAQCQYFLKLFQIPEQNLISLSYSDMLLRLGYKKDRSDS